MVEVDGPKVIKANWEGASPPPAAPITTQTGESQSSEGPSALSGIGSTSLMMIIGVAAAAVIGLVAFLKLKKK